MLLICHTVLHGQCYCNFGKEILFSRYREFQWCCWILRTILSWKWVYFRMNLDSFIIFVTYFRGNMFVFSGRCKILWVVIIVDVSINLICGGYVWYRWSLINGNHISTTIIGAVILWWGRRAWWYNKCCFGGWVGLVAPYVFIYRSNSLSRDNYLALLWSELKSEPK